jgi:hypothetical protein
MKSILRSLGFLLAAGLAAASVSACKQPLSDGPPAAAQMVVLVDHAPVDVVAMAREAVEVADVFTHRDVMLSEAESMPVITFGPPRYVAGADASQVTGPQLADGLPRNVRT